MEKFPNALSPYLNPYLSGKVRLKEETLWKSLSCYFNLHLQRSVKYQEQRERDRVSNQ